jgi:pimeloyl-ACP methyl ester carboxylesterase
VSSDTEEKIAVASDGTRLQYAVAGDGPPVLFLHGTFGSRDDFRRQLPLADRFRLILRDLRGHNGSDAHLPANYAIGTTEVADIDAVLDAEGITRASIVGHSTGGAIAYAFALTRPERVDRLVLIEATLIGLAPEEIQTVEREQRGAANALAAAGDLRGAVDLTLGRALGTDWRERSSPRMVQRADLAAAMQAPINDGLLNLGASSDGLQMIAAPTLVVHGGSSTRLHGSVFDAIARTRPDWTLLRLDGAGHAVHVQRADEVNAAIARFLAAEDSSTVRA